MKKSTIMTAALIVCLLLLAAGAWILFGGSAGFEYANADQYTAGDTTVSDPAENLDIHWISGNIIVQYHDGNGIRVSETSKKPLSEDDRMRWWLDGTTLRIQFAKAKVRIVSDLEKTLTVSLPKGTVLKTASVEATSADMSIDGLAADEIRLQSTSGDIRGTTETKKLTAGSTSGNLDIRQESAVDSAELGATSGGVGVTLGDVKTLKVSTTSGTIQVILKGKAETMKLGSTSGTIRAEAAALGRADIGATSGTVTVRTQAFDELEIGTTSGDITAALPEKPGFTCEAESVSGKFSSGILLQQDGKKYTCGNGSGKCKLGATSGNITIEKAD